MSVAQLKDYLQSRGVSVSGYLKPALIEIATAVNKMMLPLISNFEDKAALDNETICIKEMEVRNPFNSQNNLVNNFMPQRRRSFFMHWRHQIIQTKENCQRFHGVGRHAP